MSSYSKLVRSYIIHLINSIGGFIGIGPPMQDLQLLKVVVYALPAVLTVFIEAFSADEVHDRYGLAP